MGRSYECNKQIIEYKKLHKYCEKCGKKDELEVHHIIPLVEGGSDDFENFVALCSDCHKLFHNKNKSKLTKLGIEKAKKQNADYQLCPDKYDKICLVNLFDIYNWVENNEDATIAELIGFLSNLHIYKTTIKNK